MTLFRAQKVMPWLRNAKGRHPFTERRRPTVRYERTVQGSTVNLCSRVGSHSGHSHWIALQR